MVSDSCPTFHFTPFYDSFDKENTMLDFVTITSIDQ